jgi:dolichol-phosphate mannosyltransferase
LDSAPLPGRAALDSAAPRLSVILPVFNELGSLPGLVDELIAALDPLEESYEILLVDDASTDGSGAWIAEAAGRRPGVRGLALAGHEGQSAALAAGFQAARGAIFVTLDADGQNDPADIPRVLDALAGADVVSGVRARRDDRWLRRVSSRIANGVRRAVLRDGVTDVGCSLKAYRAEYVRGLPLFRGAHRFLPALCRGRGARVAELPVAHRPRRHGVSKYGVGNRLWVGIVDLLGVSWLRTRLHRHAAREAGKD